jgi:hypothetical protein
MFGAREHLLGRTRDGAYKKAWPNGEPETLRERPGDEFGLIVAAFPKTAEVERDGNNGIGAPFIALGGNKFEELIREPITEPHDFVIFHEEDGAGERVVVDRERPGAIEGIEIGTAEAA